MIEDVSLFAAFIAGLLSFVSPCVLPLVPGYLSFISGVTFDEMRGVTVVAGRGAAGVSVAAVTGSRLHVFTTSLAFVIGFSLVFVALGASASAIGTWLLGQLRILGKIAGAIIIVFGLHIIGALKLGWLYREKRIQTQKKPAGPIGAMLVGVAFAFGWTPCIGPILAGILAIAATEASVSRGVQLLAVYSAGLGIPFLLTALAMNQFLVVVGRIRRYYRMIEVASGTLLILIGVLIFSDRFSIIARYLSDYLPTY